MIANGLTLGAALLLGLAASAHCLVMCGGISAALAMATAKRADGSPRRPLLLGYQLGRITSYALAGLLLSGSAGAAIALLDDERVRTSLRALSAFALLFAALVALGRLRDPGHAIGRQLWPRIAPFGRRLLPVTNLPRAFAFGMLWGWMPCGFVYTVLLLATLTLDPLHGAATMAMFGLGTLPVLTSAAFGAARLGTSPALLARRLAAGVLLASAVLTLAAPWLIAAHAPWLHALLPLGCLPRMH